jgi:hypothetical protein
VTFWRIPMMLGLYMASLPVTGALWLLIVMLIVVVAGWALVDEVRNRHDH